MQDLVDTARELESELGNLDDPSLLSAAGKEDLGGGVSVGITVTLNNARVAFEARLGPSYVQCNISGGNLVAVDEAGATIPPVQPTAFTQIVLANSSSATLVDQELLQYTSFQNGVWVDVTTSTSGTTFPAGNRENPVNNMADAISIATDKGFAVINIIGDVTLDATANVDSFIIRGQARNLTTITINPAASTINTQFQNCTLDGTLDGGSFIIDCEIESLIYLNGEIYDSGFEGTSYIALSGNASAHFDGCHSESTVYTDLPEVDMGISGQSLAVRNYNGGLKIGNKAGTEHVSIDLNSGRVMLENSVTNGTVIVRGVGKLVDLSDNHIESGTWNGVTIINETVNENAQADAVWGSLTSDYSDVNTYGGWVKKLLSVGKFLGLK
jgi:hypothetical protein